jgi:hypothetical protein
LKILFFKKIDNFPKIKKIFDNTFFLKMDSWSHPECIDTPHDDKEKKLLVIAWASEGLPSSFFVFFEGPGYRIIMRIHAHTN